jgi:hypothetical protein
MPSAMAEPVYWTNSLRFMSNDFSDIFVDF